MRVLFVSKPMVPPYNDGSKCLVRALCGALTQTHNYVLGVKGQARAIDGAENVPLYARSSGGFAPPLLQNAKALAYLSLEQRADLHHYVFAPNPRSSCAIKLLRRVRRKPCVQTIASPPRSFEHVSDLLFGDVVVAQSEWTRRQMEAHGAREPVEVIPPPLGPLERPTRAQCAEVRQRLGIAESARVLVYPGDLEFSQGAERVARIARDLPEELRDVAIVFACRRKTDRAEEVENRLKMELRDRPVYFAGELPSLLPLLGTSSGVLFPVEELFGKVDIPITLLEAAELGIPLLLAESGPVSEMQGASLLPPDSTGSWLELIRRLLSDPELDARLRSEAQVAVREKHAASVVAAQYHRLYSRWTLEESQRTERRWG